MRPSLRAESKPALVRSRTKAGLEAARRDGRIGGRRPKLTTQQQAEIIRMVFRNDKTAADAARLFSVHPATISRLLARAHASNGLKYEKRRLKFYSSASRR
jgi:DNA invertase Pin-like site-specific DNA recombinase